MLCSHIFLKNNNDAKENATVNLLLPASVVVVVVGDTVEPVDVNEMKMCAPFLPFIYLR